MDWDSPEAEEKWCDEQREVAAAFLAAHPTEFGELGDWPAWHVAPHVAIWAIESLQAPGRVGWWAVTGDVPSDVIGGDGQPDPRSAMAGFAERWSAMAESMRRGEALPGFSVGSPDQARDLAPMLASRASVFAEWAADKDLWED
ncbi:MAG: DUF4826 family protein [Fimbriimonadaceae bacterium]|nr:DUF4826 family protein [Fimbriimonadaceae bacterium]